MCLLSDGVPGIVQNPNVLIVMFGNTIIKIYVPTLRLR